VLTKNAPAKNLQRFYPRGSASQVVAKSFARHRNTRSALPSRLCRRICVVLGNRIASASFSTNQWHAPLRLHVFSGRPTEGSRKSAPPAALLPAKRRPDRGALRPTPV
jgi:hypothetical protein